MDGEFHLGKEGMFDQFGVLCFGQGELWPRFARGAKGGIDGT